jgi:hypothetical protein
MTQQEIQPTYVTYKQAFWLKEKGFDEPCKNLINGAYAPHHLNITELGYLQQNSEILENCYTIPEQWLVIEWLRVNHGIWVCVSINGLDKTFNFDIHNYKQKGSLGNIINGGYNLPQEAYSAAFDYIISNNLI